MSDEIKGVALLDDRNPEQWLFVCCVAGDPAKSKPFIQRIPVRDAILPHKPDGPEWAYYVNGDTLDVSPSLLVSFSKPNRDGTMTPVELFHNAGRWSVRFERWSEEHPDQTLEGRYALARHLNAGYLS
jgi:hypothetical protein